MSSVARETACGSVIECASISGFGVCRGTGAGDFAVGFWAAIAEELPGFADFLDVVEVELSDEQFVFVAAGLGNDFSARIAEITLAVELANFPRCFDTHAIDGGDEILVGDGVRGLLEFPEIFGESSDGGRG